MKFSQEIQTVATQECQTHSRCRNRKNQTREEIIVDVDNCEEYKLMVATLQEKIDALEEIIHGKRRIKRRKKLSRCCQRKKKYIQHQFADKLHFVSIFINSFSGCKCQRKIIAAHY